MLSKIQTIRRGVLRVCDSVVDNNGVSIPTLVGQTSQVDVISQNGYRYRSGFWERVLNSPQVIETIKNRDMLGMTEHPTEDEAFLKTPYNLASLVVLDAWVENGNPFATFGLLNNEQGNLLKALIDVGHKPGVSTRGLGSFSKDQVSDYVDESNYMFITWDIVRSPNFADLKMDKVTDSLRNTKVFQELTQMYALRDSVDENYSKSGLEYDIDLAIKALTSIKNKLLQHE